MGWSVPLLLSVMCARLTVGVPDGADFQGNGTEPGPAAGTKMAFRSETIRVLLDLVMFDKPVNGGKREGEKRARWKK